MPICHFCPKLVSSNPLRFLLLVITDLATHISMRTLICWHPLLHSDPTVTTDMTGAITGGVVAVAFIITIAVVTVVLLGIYCRGLARKKYVIPLYVVSTVKCYGDFSPCMVALVASTTYQKKMK